MELKLKPSAQARGTRILARGKATKYRAICDALVRMAIESGAEEIVLPCIEPLSAHQKFEPQLYTFPDRFSPDQQVLCLHPDGTAVCREIATTVWKHRQDLKLFYVTKCWRANGPTLGNNHEFTQFGYELLNSRSNKHVQEEWMTETARKMIGHFSPSFASQFRVREAKNLGAQFGRGFEIVCDYLGAQKKVCSGGPHLHGYGFEIFIERMMLLD